MSTTINVISQTGKSVLVGNVVVLSSNKDADFNSFAAVYTNVSPVQAKIIAKSMFTKLSVHDFKALGLNSENIVTFTGTDATQLLKFVPELDFNHSSMNVVTDTDNTIDKLLVNQEEVTVDDKVVTAKEFEELKVADKVTTEEDVILMKKIAGEYVNALTLKPVNFDNVEDPEALAMLKVISALDEKGIKVVRLIVEQVVSTIFGEKYNNLENINLDELINDLFELTKEEFESAKELFESKFEDNLKDLLSNLASEEVKEEKEEVKEVVVEKVSNTDEETLNEIKALKDEMVKIQQDIEKKARSLNSKYGNLVKRDKIATESGAIPQFMSLEFLESADEATMIAAVKGYYKEEAKKSKK